MDSFLKKKKQQVKTFAGPGAIAITGSTCKHCKDCIHLGVAGRPHSARGAPMRRAALAIKGPLWVSIWSRERQGNSLAGFEAPVICYDEPSKTKRLK